MSDVQKVKLVLENGREFQGKSFGYRQSVSGEVVFNTAMMGYPESLTDPSYRGQILVSTHPLVGNYGVPGEELEDNMFKFFESGKIQVSGFVISDYSFQYSHWNAKESLSDWLQRYKIPGVYDIDTRALTKILREKGTMLGKIVADGQDVDFYDPGKENLVAQVSCTDKEVYGTGDIRIVLIDCGVKHNIIRCLTKRGATVIRVPWDYDYSKEDYDALFISNGPGDPKMCTATIRHLQQAIREDKPIMGICLGTQLLALAAGANTYKLKYGHRSHNQPVIIKGTNRCYITSQNHGYAIDNDTLPSDWEPLFININDNTSEGLKHKTKPMFASQFHPEATSGPTDTEFLFDDFMAMIKGYKSKK